MMLKTTTRTLQSTISRSSIAGAARSFHVVSGRSEEQKPFSEGHATRKPPLDVQSEQVKKAGDHKADVNSRGKSESNGPKDAIYMSNNGGSGEAQQYRQQNTTAQGKKLGFQPGQMGEQVGGHMHGQRGEGDSVGEKKEARSSTGNPLSWDSLKGVFGGPGKKFSTFARAQMEGKDDREDKFHNVKDGDAAGEQNPHLHHREPGTGDQAPAVKNSASLPSGGGGEKDQALSPSGRSGENKPSYEGNQHDVGGTFVSTSQPSAVYSHVHGSPEPDSYKSNYQPASQTPSGAVPRSSTSTSTPNPATTSHLDKNPSGIGSSHKVHSTTGEADAVAKEGASNTIKGSEKGGRAYTVPPEFNEERKAQRPPREKESGFGEK